MTDASAYPVPVGGASGFQSDIAHLMARLSPLPGQAIIETRCGTGDHLRALALATDGRTSFLGVSDDPGMITVARHLASTLLPAVARAIAFRRSDLCAMVLPSGAFAGGFIRVHGADMAGPDAMPDAILSELARVILPGGWMVCIGIGTDGETMRSRLQRLGLLDVHVSAPGAVAGRKFL